MVKSIKLISIILISGSICRLYVPYYLTAVNPVIVQEMVNGMQEQQQAEKNKLIRNMVRSEGSKMMGDAPVLGNRDAKKTVYVWTDFSCPYCRRVHGELERVLADRDDVRVVVTLGHLRHESVGGDCGADAFDLVRRDGDADAGAAHEHARVAFAGSHRLRDLEPVDGIVHRLLGEGAEVDDLCAERLEGLFDGGFQHDAAVITADCNFHNTPLIG